MTLHVGDRRTDGPPGRVRASWAALDTAAGHRRVAGTGVVALFALAVGSAIGAIALATGSAPAVDTAGLGIGATSVTVGTRPTDGWLPAPRLLLAPFTAVFGVHLAVPLLGIACLVVAAAALYRIAVRVSLGRGGRIAAVVVLVAAPTTLYQQTTTSTGPVLVAAILATVAGLARWARVKRTPSGGELAIFAGVPCTVAVLTRYEGWILLAAGLVFVLLVARQKGRDLRFVARMTLSFTVVPVVGVLWWLAYNYSTRGGPFAGTGDLDTALGMPSTASTEIPADGMLRSLTEALPAAATGATAIVIALLGVAAAGLRYRWSDRLWVVGLLAVGAAVDVVLVAQAVNAGDPGAGWVGRFALPAVPAMAVLAGLAVDFGRRAVRMRSAVTAMLPLGLAVVLIGAASALPGGADAPRSDVASPAAATTAAAPTGTSTTTPAAASSTTPAAASTTTPAAASSPAPNAPSNPDPTSFLTETT